MTKGTDIDRELENVIRGRMASNSLGFLEPILFEMEDRVDRRVFKQLVAGKGLTPDQALQAWYEKAAIVQLRERLQQLANSGKSAGRRVQENMEIGNGQA